MGFNSGFKGLIGTTIHPDMQKIRIIGLFFEKQVTLTFRCGKKILQTAVLGYIFIYVQTEHQYTIPYMYLADGENFKR